MSKIGKYKWIVAGAVVACGLGIYYLSDDSSGSQSRLSRSSVILVIKDLRKALTPHLITLASYAVTIKEKYPDRLTESQIRQILVQHSKIPDIIQKCEDQVYTKHSTTASDFQTLCNTNYQEDLEVQTLLKDLQKAISDAFTGIYPLTNIEIPDFMSAELTLVVLQDLYEATVYGTYKKFKQLVNEGINVKPGTEEYEKMTVEMEADTDEQKKKVFKYHGMCELQEEPKSLLHAAVQKYKDSVEFIQRVKDSELYFKGCIELIGAGRFPEEEGRRLESKFEFQLISS